MEKVGAHPVRLAFWITAVCAVVGIADAVANVVALRGFDAVLADRRLPAEYDDLSTMRTRLMLSMVVAIGAAVVVLLAMLLMPRAWPYSRLAVSLALAAAALALVFSVIYAPMEITGSPNSDSPATLQALADLLPGWHPMTHSMFTGLTAIAAAVVVMLLLKPRAVEYYEFDDPDRSGFVDWFILGRESVDDRS